MHACSTEEALLFSIVIPVYNIENHLVECLDSLSNQHLNKNSFEVLVIDDCSTDQTKTIAQSYQKLAQYYVHSTDVNGGPGAARNVGIDHAKGEYILFLDGDDLLTSQALKILSDYVIPQEIDVLTFNWAYYANFIKDKSLAPQNQYLSTMPEERLSTVQNYLSGNMDGSVIYTCVKTELLRTHNIKFPLGFHEDIFIIFQIYYWAQHAKVINDVIYLKKDREDSIIHTLTEKHIRGFLASWPDIMDYIILIEGAKAKLLYGRYYKRGINGLVCSLLDKISLIGSATDKSEFNKLSFNLLKNDPYLDFNRLDEFPLVSKKDKQARCFYDRMIALESIT